MKNNRTLLLSILLLLGLLLGLAFPQPVHAALSILSIDPNRVVNDVPNTITVSGSDFAPGAVVKIGGSDISTSDSMVTNYMSSTTLIANIPQGYDPGVYTVYVLNPDTSSVSAPAGLTVALPTVPPTPTPGAFMRPQIAVQSYSMSVGSIVFGQPFTLTVRLVNPGGARAVGVQVSFTSSDLLMLGNGGIVYKDKINKGDAVDISQAMTAATYLWTPTTSVDMTVSYYDDKGTQYTDKFTLNLKVLLSSGGTKATATPTGTHMSQLIIKDYKTDLEVLQPGLTFKLELNIQNMGDLPAKAVTLILGGGSSSSGGGTPGPGGVSGGGGDFTNFAPVGSSNVQSLGEIAAGTSLTVSKTLIVNVNTNAGAYPMRVTLSYVDSKGMQVNDEQIITLLVYRLPNVDISFYQPVGDLSTFQPGPLPLQVVNLGRQPVILGNMTVSSAAGTLENGKAFIGNLDTAGYFTLDSTFTPEVAGELEILVSIDYTDDFNQTRTITKALKVNVLEMAPELTPDANNPSFNGEGTVSMPETFLQKVWRFVLGLFGLDSGTSSGSGGSGTPTETVPNIKPVPLPSGGGKG